MAELAPALGSDDRASTTVGAAARPLCARPFCTCGYAMAAPTELWPHWGSDVRASTTRSVWWVAARPAFLRHRGSVSD